MPRKGGLGKGAYSRACPWTQVDTGLSGGAGLREGQVRWRGIA
jgi:hypothetical protein